MTINFNGIEIEIIRKAIKNIHLSVRHVDGRVTLSVPFSLPKAVINDFLNSKEAWIKKQRKKFETAPKIAMREYISNEIVLVIGKSYNLIVIEAVKNNIEIVANDVIFHCKHGSTAAMREKYFNKWYKELLLDIIPPLMEKWSCITNFHCTTWQIRNMKTRWGTYSQKTDKIWLNLQLASKPLECIEYVVLHELAHTKVLNHGKDFASIMDKFMPNWKSIKKQLNCQMQ